MSSGSDLAARTASGPMPAPGSAARLAISKSGGKSWRDPGLVCDLGDDTTVSTERVSPMTERSLFFAVLEIDDPVRRAAYLEGACEGEPGLRERVEDLLRSHESIAGFM